MSKEIKDIASDPDEHYAIEADSYDSLTKIKDIVKQCICMGISKDLFFTPPPPVYLKVSLSGSISVAEYNAAFGRIKLILRLSVRRCETSTNGEIRSYLGNNA